MDEWEKLDTLEDALFDIGEAMAALRRIDRDAVAELADIRGRVAVATEKQRAIVRELEEQEEDALRREYERGLL